MLRLALVCALVAVAVTAPTTTWMARLSTLLVNGTDYNSNDGVTTTSCKCNGCDGHYTRANPEIWGVDSVQYKNDPAKGCAAACFNNETNNRPLTEHEYPNTKSSTDHKGCKVSLYNSDSKQCFLYDHGMTSLENGDNLEHDKFTCWASNHECHTNRNCKHHNPTPVPTLVPTAAPIHQAILSHHGWQFFKAPQQHINSYSKFLQACQALDSRAKPLGNYLSPRGRTDSVSQSVAFSSTPTSCYTRGGIQTRSCKSGNNAWDWESYFCDENRSGNDNECGDGTYYFVGNIHEGGGTGFIPRWTSSFTGIPICVCQASYNIGR